MKNNKGFTLVEVLAVIAILMILVTLSVPRIRTIYDKAKENIFLTEFKNLERQITNKEVIAKMNKKKIVAISSEDETSLELSNKDFKYCIDLNKNGTFSRMQASDGKHYIEANRGDDINSFTNKNIIKGGYDKLRCVFDENKSLKNVILANNKTYPDNKKSDTVESENGIDFSKPASATNGIGLFYNYNSDDINSDGKVDKTYYFRGLVYNNNVLFAGGCYKVVKIAEDGAVKLAYIGTTYNGSCNETYSYGTYNGKYNDSIDYMTDEDSIVKTSVDRWYKENILQYQEYIQDTVYCNDRSKDENENYNVNNRLRGSNSAKPTNKCNNEDSFTVSDKVGNGKLKYPAGLLTADEYVYSGGSVSATSNMFTTFMIGQYYTMSPQSNDNIYIVSKAGLATSSVDNSEDYNTVPIISLNSKAIVIHGDGSQESPYEIRTDSNDVVKDCATNVYKKGTILNKMLSSDCAYSANKKSKNVARLDGINFNDGWESTPVSYTYTVTKNSYMYMYDYKTNEYEFYEKMDFDSSTGKFILSGKVIKGKWNTSSVCTESSCPVLGYYVVKGNTCYKITENTGTFYANRTNATEYYPRAASYGKNGQGLYYTEDKNLTYDGKRIYFYRGKVDNNYVAIENSCYKIIRTDENNNVKLLYYGTYDKNKCYEKADGIGEYKYSNLEKDNTYVGYMFGDVTKLNVNNATIGSFSMNESFSEDYEYDKNSGLFKLKGKTISGKLETDEVCSVNACPVKNYYTCRKENKDEGCEILYQILGKIAGDSYFNVKEYRMNSASYAEATSNKYDSNAKKVVDAWYEKEFKNSKVKLQDTIFCNDRSISSGKGYGTIETTYSRNFGFGCKQQNDKFTVSNKVGNRKLKYPVGLITKAELNIYNNIRMYFYTITPSAFLHSSSVYTNYSYDSYTTYEKPIVPMIAIKGNEYVSQGTGRYDDPYLIVGGK